MREKNYGNAGGVESAESQKRASHPSHRSLGISQKTRDSHISTVSTATHYLFEAKSKNPRNCRPWKSGNPKSGFTLFHRLDSLRRKEERLQKRQQKEPPFRRQQGDTSIEVRMGTFLIWSDLVKSVLIVFASFGGIGPVDVAAAQATKREAFCDG